ncbi:unnamed protein product [Closterium sp. NIES-65]|nr:unnamed protein product [Closterium sp. NIES-65]
MGRDYQANLTLGNGVQLTRLGFGSGGNARDLPLVLSFAAVHPLGTLSLVRGGRVTQARECFTSSLDKAKLSGRMLVCNLKTRDVTEAMKDSTTTALGAAAMLLLSAPANLPCHARECFASSLDKSKLSGRMLVCNLKTRDVREAMKDTTTAALGAAAVLLLSASPSSPAPSRVPYTDVPAIHLNAEDSGTVRQYLSKATNPTRPSRRSSPRSHLRRSPLSGHFLLHRPASQPLHLIPCLPFLSVPHFPRGRGAGTWRGREAGTWRGREAGTWQGREAGTWRGREAGMWRGREAGTWRGREVGMWRGREAGKWRGREAGTWRGREAGTWRGREAGTWWGREVGTWRGREAGTWRGREAVTWRGREAGTWRGLASFNANQHFLFLLHSPPSSPLPSPPSPTASLSHILRRSPISRPPLLHKPASQPLHSPSLRIASLSPPFTTFSDEAPPVAYFSSTGPPLNPAFSITPRLLASNDILKPDIIGPGFQLWAASSGLTPSSSSEPPKLDYLSGTSMATPHLAGSAALIIQKNPN